MAQVLTRDRTLSGLREDLDRESGWLDRLWRVEAVAAGAFGLAALGEWVWRGQVRLAIPGALAGLLAAGHRWKVRENRAKARAVRAGQRGESSVLRHLERGLAGDAFILNDLDVRRGRHHHQIDHLVVTPGGLFVVETKRWRGRITGSAHAASWSVEYPDGTRSTRSNPLRQNRAHVDLVARCLEAWGEADLVPVPVLVLAGGTPVIDDAETPILTPSEVAGWIGAQPPILDPDRCARIARRFLEEAR